MIASDLAAFLQDGQAIHIGTRDEQLQPNGGRAAAMTVEDDGRHVVVYVAEVAARRLMPDLESNGQVAVVVCRPTDDRTCQIKGILDSIREARPDERPVVDAQWKGLLDKLAHLGIPAETAGGWITWPAVAIRVRTTALFDQTPGPTAGAPLA